MDWNQIAEGYLAVADQIFGTLREDVDRIADDIAGRLKQGNKLMICGNGGSAADAQHMSAEFINRFKMEREPYAALALTTDTSTLTSISNDYAYEEIFEKQIKALGKEGDVLLGISTSGGAGNVCRAVERAKQMNILTIGMTGGQGGKLAGLVDQLLNISCTSDTARIQEGHGLVIHALCERIEEALTK